jgi:predicted HicB family RNase H-like nuclease
MPVSAAKIKANAKYSAKAYERISLVVKKGKREEIKAYAESSGKSLNGYITGLIEKDMNRVRQKPKLQPISLERPNQEEK